jgi:hypothetical protein
MPTKNEGIIIWEQEAKSFMTAVNKKTKKPINDPTMKVTICSFRFFR